MGTHYRGTKRETRALDAFVKLMRGAESVAARMAARKTLDGLTESQFGVLEALHHLGPLCQKEVGRKVLRSSGNITMVVDRLEELGLAIRKRGGGDRRLVSVEITKAGKARIEKILPGHVAAIVEEMGALEAGEQEKLGELCRKLGLRAEAGGRTGAQIEKKTRIEGLPLATSKDGGKKS